MSSGRADPSSGKIQSVALAWLFSPDRDQGQAKPYWEDSDQTMYEPAAEQQRESLKSDPMV